MRKKIEMSNEELKQIKEFVFEELKKSYSSATFNLWFSSMRVVELVDECITVSIPRSKKAFVETQYYDALKSKFSEILGFDVNLKLITDEEEAEMIKLFKSEESGNNDLDKDMSAYKMRFNPNYTFENFVVGKSNQLAQSAALAVAKHPAQLNNPLFLYGPSGLGKTHLMFAIVAEIRKNHPDYNVLYVTGEEFTNGLVKALADRTTTQFREKFRNVDVLLVDDIQFIAGKMSTQEEFFHTFDALFQMNKQIILAADCPPQAMDNLQDRLKSRFEMGLVADIQPPDLELRVAIFKRKADDFGFDLDIEILYYLAKNITSNIRQIEGALKKLRAHSLITGQVCDLYTAKEVLNAFFVNAKSEESVIERIFECAEKRFGVTQEEMKSSKRNAEIIIARHYAIYLIRKCTNLSQKSIAKLFNKKDHTTVINSVGFIERKMQDEPNFDREIKALIAELS